MDINIALSHSQAQSEHVRERDRTILLTIQYGFDKTENFIRPAKYRYNWMDLRERYVLSHDCTSVQ